MRARIQDRNAFPASPVLGPLPKQTESRGKWKQDVCVVGGVGWKGYSYPLQQSNLVWGPEVATSKEECQPGPHGTPLPRTHVPPSPTGEDGLPALTCRLAALEVYDAHPLEARAAFVPSRIDQGEVSIRVSKCLQHTDRVWENRERNLNRYTFLHEAFCIPSTNQY